MTVVITGASGHIGNNLVRKLIAEGRSVRALIHEESHALDNVEVERVKGDVLKKATLIKAFDRAEVVYHLAACISIGGNSEDVVYDVNVDGTRNVVSACLECGVKRLVHFSSIHALSAVPLDGVVDETRPLVNGQSSPAYDRTKAEGERVVQAGLEKGLNAVIVNPTSVIGLNDYEPSLMGNVLLGLFRRRFPALIDGGFNWVDVQDVIDGATRAEKKGRTGERYLLGGAWLSLKELASVVESVGGVKAPRFVSPMWLARLGAPFSSFYARALKKRPLYTSHSLKALRGHRFVSFEKAKSELDYQPRPIRQTIETIHRWFKETGQL